MENDTVQQIKDRLSIIDVVGQYIKLRKAGQNFIAKCPFHNEKTPSFNVSPARNAYHCFGCGQGGDIFTFVEHFEGVDFPGALKILADRAGVEVVFRSGQKERRDERERLFALMEDAVVFFKNNLSSAKRVRAYLMGRGLTEETISHFCLGFAKREWHALHEHLKGKGYSDTEIESAGLIKKKEGVVRLRSPQTEGYYDRFRGRIMFPIADPAGRVIAFTGRLFDDVPPARRGRNGKKTDGGAGDSPRNRISDEAKYVNSPETALFSKSHVLYGYDKAKFSIRKYDFSILVEGQMDFLLSFQAGYTNTVAVSGTALTRDQLALLKRLSGNIVMAYDADSAGVASSGKGAALALSLGMDVKVAALPSGFDPADLVQRGNDEWKKAIKESKHIIDFYLDIIFRSKDDMRARRLEVTRSVLPFVARITNKVDQAHFIATIADRLNVPETAIRDEVGKVPSDDARIGENIVLSESGSALQRAEIVSAHTVGDRKTNIEVLLTRLLSALDSPDVYKKKLRTLVGTRRFNELFTEGSTPSLAEHFALENRAFSNTHVKREIDDLFLNLKKEYIEESCRTLAYDLKHAEMEGDTAAVAALESRLKQKSDQLVQIKTKLS